MDLNVGNKPGSAALPVITPPTAPLATPAPVAPPPTPYSGAQESPKTDDPLDMTTLQVSMDAAIASINAGEDGEMAEPEPLPPPPPEPMPMQQASSADVLLEGDAKGKQEQLRAMYLAGFRAATQAQQHHSLHTNFELAKHVPNSAAPVVEGALGAALLAPVVPAPPAPASVVVPVDSSIAAGVIKIQPNLATSAPSAGILVDPNRRITRTSSSSLSSSPAVSSTSSPASTGHSNPFPRKLMEMLRKEDSGIVAWLPRGDAFSVRDPDRFVTDILPRYFRHTKVSGLLLL
jgi:hypothetical protein